MIATLLAALALVAPAAPAVVRAWEGHLDLPTYEEDAPDVNPPFDLFETRRFNYPYTLRENLTDRRVTARWRTLEIENEYLHCTVLPDLGGHLYGCVDKSNGAQMFYANTAIKKARVAYRGSWTALGVEFNFPVSHNWATVSPVDHAVVAHPDGSASLFVGNVDRVYGMQWRVGLTLRPGSSALEQDVTLYNPGDVRHRFYWWNNAGVQVWDDSRIEYPMRFTASHGFKAIDTWPVNQAGVDLSVVGNHTFGPVSEFSHGSREAFMGVYHPRTQSGVVHYSSPQDAPTKKIWSWSRDADGLDWRKALSDDGSAYVEVQAGLFRNQETYAFLEPQEVIHFREYWMPVRRTGGITRANPDAVLHLARPEATRLAVDLNVSRAVRAGTLRVRDGARVVAEAPFHLTPAESLRREFADLSSTSRYTVEASDDAGRVLIAHTEDVFDMTPAAEIQVGPTPRLASPPADQRSDGDYAEIGRDQELNGKRLLAWSTYDDGLKRFPDSLLLLRAAGRLGVELERYAEAADLLQKAAARATTDASIRYHLGLARAALGDDARARTEWEAARPFRAFAAPATLKLAQLESRAGNTALALERVRQALAAEPQAVRLGALEIALLRHAGSAAEARDRLARWRAVDPTSSILRYEAVRLGTPDEALFAHLGADPQRVLNVAVEYMGLGLWADALDLLDRRYPVATGLLVEPGAVPPQDDPEVAYYRGYSREKSGGSGTADYAAASKLSTRYVFPSRPESLVVLRRALAANPGDATAHFLLGSLLLASGRAADAVGEWQEARRLDPRIPVLHRNLGRTLLQVNGDPEAALAVFTEGVGADPANVDLYLGADQAMSLLGRPAEERVALFQRFPSPAAMPPELLQRLALALAEVGRAAEGKALLAGRFFPREEWGTNVRQVFVEIRLSEALALARAGRSAEALAIVEGLEQEVPGFTFTQDGLDAFVRTPRVQYTAGEIAALAGDTAAARAHWTAAVTAKEGMFRGAPYVSLAARKLGTADDAASRARLDAALAESDVFLEAGTSFPGVVAQAQGVLLHVLGRDDEARARLRKALVLPDQRLSHFLARRALAGDAVKAVNAVDYFVIALYMALMLGIGFYAARFNRGASDYFKGGNRIPWLVAGLSSFMSGFSAWTFTGAAGLAYQHGMVAILLYVGNAATFLLGYWIFAVRWRRARISTVMEYLVERYDERTRQVFSWSTVFFQLFTGATMLYGLGLFVASTCKLPLVWTIAGSGAIILAYCVVGGLWAVVITDFLQAVILMPFTLVMLFASLQRVGGVSGLLAGLPPEVKSLALPGDFGWLYVGCWTIMVSFGYNTAAMAQRYFSVDDERSAKKVALLCFVLFLLGAAIWFVPPLAMRVLYPDLGAMLPGVKNPHEASYAVAALTLLPNGLVGIMLAAMFSATMSSLSGLFNMHAAVVSKDIYQTLLGKRSTEKELLVVGWIATFGVGATMTALAMGMAARGASIFGVMLTFNTVMSLAYGPPALLGLISKRTPSWSGLLTFVVGLSLGLYGAFVAHWTPVQTLVRSVFLIIPLATLAFFASAWFERDDPAHRERREGLFRRLATPIDVARELGGNPDPTAEVFRFLSRATAAVGLASLLLIFEAPPGEKSAVVFYAVTTLLVAAALTRVGRAPAVRAGA